MTIDERLERLTERHEALAQSLELMQHIQSEDQTRWNDRWNQIATAIQQDAENIRALARIAAIHERRLSHLEGAPE
jgi:hypothetical protein